MKGSGVAPKNQRASKQKCESFFQAMLQMNIYSNKWTKTWLHQYALSPACWESLGAAVFASRHVFTANAVLGVYKGGAQAHWSWGPEENNALELHFSFLMVT